MNDSVSQSVNYEAVYRTAPATPGLLKSVPTYLSTYTSERSDSIDISESSDSSESRDSSDSNDSNESSNSSDSIDSSDSSDSNDSSDSSDWSDQKTLFTNFFPKISQKNYLSNFSSSSIFY